MNLAWYAEVLQMIEKKMIIIDEEKLGYEEKLEVLLSGRCRSIFPISIIKDDEGLKGFYYTSGFIPLTNLENVSALQVLSILEKTIAAIEECKQYLLFPDEYVINTETAYISKDYEEVKFTYVPKEKDASVSSKLALFVRQLKDVTTDNGILYLNMLEEMISLENLSFKGIKNMLIQLKREINICNII